MLKDITHKQSEAFILSTYQRGAKYHAALQLRHLKASFNFAIRRGYIPSNPLEAITLRLPERPQIFITKDELNKIIQTETNPILSLIYEFLFFTGCRIGEVINLQFSHIDTSSNKINIQNSATFKTKSGKNRIIPMSKVVVRIISIMKDQKINEFVFGKRYSSSYISHRFKRITRAIELNEHLRLHDLRHSFASSLVQKGVSLYVVKEILGHKNISTTEKYSHLHKQNLVDAIKVLDD